MQGRLFDVLAANPLAQVGPLELRHEKVAVPDADRQLLVISHAEPGSPNAERLALLASLAVPVHDAEVNPDTADSPTSG
ncbi:MmyB family transcriptional regulator [Nocardia miyunensis]|uniref:MmyB family transcriptional regulator n=1 Tax=Nocardia miyunensis TaxID=282684 RepID=UPI0008320ABB|nr:hypothetical protein [Nocardia miyunensis]